MIVGSKRSLGRVVVLFSSLLAAGCSASGQQAPQASTTPASAVAATPTEIKAQAVFDKFMARPEPLYKWEKGQSNGNIFNLSLTSQEWQGKPWTHRIEIVRPVRLEFPDLAIINVSVGSGQPAETFAAQLVANAVGATVINLFNVPNQPLYGMYEDDLISYTFKQYLETKDPNWPLLLPMTKSALKAMDAITEYSRQAFDKPITHFVIVGASKRGWTTWLIAAADARLHQRVVGIIPVVYNNLNLQEQMPHQLASWGRYSEMIEDYTKRGLQGMMTTPEGRQLVQIIDPWTYRDRLTMPKFIINASNDRYWPLDALSLYQTGLPGSTNVLYVPNASHAMEGHEQYLAGAAAAWLHRLAAGEPFPQVSLEVPKTVTADGSRHFEVTVSEAPQNVSLWVARSATHDFRASQWVALPMQSDGSAGPGHHYNVSVPAATAELPNVAVFGDAEFAAQPLPLHLSTQIFLWSRGQQ